MIAATTSKARFLRRLAGWVMECKSMVKAASGENIELLPMTAILPSGAILNSIWLAGSWHIRSIICSEERFLEQKITSLMRYRVSKSLICTMLPMAGGVVGFASVSVVMMPQKLQ